MMSQIKTSWKDPEGSLQLLLGCFTRKGPLISINSFWGFFPGYNSPTEAVKTPWDLFLGHNWRSSVQNSELSWNLHNCPTFQCAWVSMQWVNVGPVQHVPFPSWKGPTCSQWSHLYDVIFQIKLKREKTGNEGENRREAWLAP